MTNIKQLQQQSWEREFDSRFDYALIESVIRDMGDDVTWLEMKKHIKIFIKDFISNIRREAVEEYKKQHNGKPEWVTNQENRDLRANPPIYRKKY